MTSFLQWIDDKTQEDWWIYTKRLSANDTGLTGGKGVGVYVPKTVARAALVTIALPTTKNPSCPLKAQVSSHSFPEQNIKGIYYNNKFFPKIQNPEEPKKKTKENRNEHRLTRWNTDIKNSPVQDPANTGALSLFAFYIPKTGENAKLLDVWVCKDLDEEELIENLIGEVIPGNWLFDRGDKLFSGLTKAPDTTDSLLTVPEIWIDTFPKGEEIINHLSKVFHFKQNTPDKLIVERRLEEYKLFRKIEERHILHKIKKGFDSVDEFMQLANSVSNRRKSRSGKSLELHLEYLFRQFGLTSFSTQCKTEGNKRPDFIFPSCADYRNPEFPEQNLRMLAVKTTCKDRWRQILNEANRIEKIHLFTLQEGVSPQQLEEMSSENVILVVPEPLHKKYPKPLRNKLMTLHNFIEEAKNLEKQKP